VNGCLHRRAEHKDDVWEWDFVFDHTTSGSQLKWLSIVDEHTRECLALKVDRTITSEDVIHTCRATCDARRAKVRSLGQRSRFHRVGNSALAWSRRRGGAVHRAREPVGERLRRELPQPATRRVLGIGGVREPISGQAADQAKQWRRDYNHSRPHRSLGYVTPTEFAARCALSVRATPLLPQHSGIT